MMPPKDWYEPIIMPAIMTFFGLMIYLFGWNAERHGKSAPWKWIGALVLLLGIFFGYGPFMDYQDPFYRAALPGNKRVVIMYYATLLLPLLSLLGCIVLHFLPKPATGAPTVTES